MIVENEYRFYVCPNTRREIVVVPENEKVFCPECNKEHFVPDGKSHSMDWFKQHNMCEISW